MGRFSRNRVSRDRSTSSSSSSSSSRSRSRTRKRISSSRRTDRSYTPPRAEDSESRIRQLERKLDELSKQNAVLTQQREVRMTVTSDCIPEFSPDNKTLSSSQWIEKIEQIRQVNNWNDVTTIYHMQSRLTGMAKSWYHSLSNYNHSWAEWKALIRKTFPENIDFATILRKMLNRQKLPNESMTTYYFEKMELLRICEITGKKSVSCIIDGILDPVIQNSARAGRYVSPEALYEQYLFALGVENVRKPTNEESTSNIVIPGRDLRHKTRKRQHSQPRMENIQMKCFNCHEKGHVFAKCKKPKVFCAKCNRVGHTADNCNSTFVRGSGKQLHSTVGKQILPVSSEVTSVQKLNDNYFIDCVIQGVAFRGYVDSGCSAVTIRASDVIKLGLKPEQTQVRLSGFGGGIVNVNSKVEIDLTVDLANANVTALIIPDEYQKVSLIIGQPFINHINVILVVRDTQVRLFNKNCFDFPQLESLPNKKVTLWAKETTVIPPNHIGHVSIYSNADFEEVYVDLSYRFIPGRCHVIPRCITKCNAGVLPVLNISDNIIEFSQSVVVARGYACTKQELCSEESCLSISQKNLEPFKINDLNRCIDVKISEQQKLHLLNLLNKYRSCFAMKTCELGTCRFSEMSIKLCDDQPITYRPYRLSYSQRDKVRGIVNDLLENDIIRESQSPYASPILLVKKKNGEERMCVDYRALNNKTIKDKYPLPRIDDLLDRLKGCKYFTSLDLASGYHQIPISEQSIDKTAFITPDGHYEYLRMPFGLVNAPAVFQRTMNTILGSMRFSSVMAYLDDILIPSADIKTGFERLEQILQILKNAGMTLRLDKCRFLQTEIEYLGHQIDEEGIRPGAYKIKAVAEYTPPGNVHEVRRFLGLVSYFRKFIKDFAMLARPLTNLTKKSAIFQWGVEEQDAFIKLREKLITRPVLTIYDPLAETEVHTDASKWGIGGILLQKQTEGSFKPVQYFSRATTAAEQNYHSYELETLAVVNSLQKFKVYLIGKQFKVVTDCNALRTTLTKRDLVPRIARWWLATQEFDFIVQYRPGCKMNHVDALSRNPHEKSDSYDDIQIMQVNIDEDDWILSAQLSDEKCRQIHAVLSQQPQSVEDKELHKSYVLKDKRIYRKSKDGLKWMVPKNARRQILTYYHDGAGHLALEKTIEAIGHRYWFPSMRKYVKNYILACLGCLYNKKPSGKTPGSLHSIEKKDIPMDTLHIDHLGPFVKSVKKNCYVIVAIDAFTKFTFIKPVANTKCSLVIKFLNEIIKMFGVPRRIICDRGSAYTSKNFTKYCEEFGIKRVLCATATPRANGQVERMNKVILASINASTDNEDRWDDCIDRVQWGINTTVNSTTGKSPYEILMGYRPRGMNDAFLAHEICEEESPLELVEVRAKVAERIKEKQAVQKLHYDARHAKPKKFEVGQQVLVYKTKCYNDGKSKKLEPKYQGPFVITKVLDNDRYVVEDMPGAKRSQKAYTGICSSEKLKLFRTVVSSDSSEKSEDDS